MKSNDSDVKITKDFLTRLSYRLRDNNSNYLLKEYKEKKESLENSIDKMLFDFITEQVNNERLKYYIKNCNRILEKPEYFYINTADLGIEINKDFIENLDFIKKDLVNVEEFYKHCDTRKCFAFRIFDYHNLGISPFGDKEFFKNNKDYPILRNLIFQYFKNELYKDYIIFKYNHILGGYPIDKHGKIKTIEDLKSYPELYRIYLDNKASIYDCYIMNNDKYYLDSIKETKKLLNKKWK